MIRILRRIAWRVTRLVAAFVVIWSAGVALERVRARWADLGEADDTMDLIAAWGAFRRAVRSAGDRQPDLEEAWNTHDELVARLRAVRLTVPPAR